MKMKTVLADNEKALGILKRLGPKSISDLADHMNVTTEGARFHLLKLESRGMVESESVAEGRGRPKQIWSLTEKGHNRFPDRHASLTANLIEIMRETLGEDAVDQVIDKHQQKMEERYSKETWGASTLKERLSLLADIRTREGYMAEFKTENCHFLFIENHCPICSAAKVCQKFCRAELQAFQSVLGERVLIERTDHMVAGGRRCAYKISEG